jgi:hypothetical protein
MITTKNYMPLKMFLVEEQKISLTVGKRADAAPHYKVLLCGVRTLYFPLFLSPNMIGISSNSVSKIGELAIHGLSTLPTCRHNSVFRQKAKVTTHAVKKKEEKKKTKK